MITLSYDDKDELVSIHPDSPRGQAIYRDLQSKLDKLLVDEKQAAVETGRRRKAIRDFGEDFLILTNRSYIGIRNEFYIGPDVENKKIIFVTGTKANLPIEQMKRDGKRSRLRAKRVTREYKNSINLNNALRYEDVPINDSINRGNDPYNI